METNLDAIKKRIKKLLALSKSKNENEASIALEKANALMEEFKITEAEAQIFVEGKTKAVKSNSPWRSKLAQDVAWLYMAKPVWETETVTAQTAQSFFVSSLFLFQQDLKNGGRYRIKNTTH